MYYDTNEWSMGTMIRNRKMKIDWKLRTVNMNERKTRVWNPRTRGKPVYETYDLEGNPRVLVDSNDTLWNGLKRYRMENRRRTNDVTGESPTDEWRLWRPADKLAVGVGCHAHRGSWLAGMEVIRRKRPATRGSVRRKPLRRKLWCARVISN